VTADETKKHAPLCVENETRSELSPSPSFSSFLLSDFGWLVHQFRLEQFWLGLFCVADNDDDNCKTFSQTCLPSSATQLQ
jgi:hypothetical protein